MTLGALTRRGGGSTPPRSRERSLWVVGDARDAFEAAAAAIEAIGPRHPRIQLLLSGPRALHPWLAERFPDGEILVQPAHRRGAARRALMRTRCRTVIALEDAALSAAFLGAIADEGLALVALGGRSGARAPQPEVARTADAVLDVAALGLDPALDIVAGLLARDHKLRRGRPRVRFTPTAFLLDALARPIGRSLLGRRLTRFADRDALAAGLRRPEHILCVGNGPSSEDPELSATPFDALFRVNRSWVERGVLVQPDVVFTGSPKTMSTLDGVTFGVQSDASERALVAARFFRPGVGPTRFFRVGDVSPDLAAHPWGPVRPTNGAAMVAAAVALAPARLTIAGIDMFSHPDGAYPGDDATPNAFAPAHDLEAELAFLMDLFAGYSGELVIVGDVLRTAWERHRAGVALRTPEPSG